MVITDKSLISLMEDSSALDKYSVDDLKSLIVEYPFFSAARVLLLKNYYNLADFRFSPFLSRVSVYVPDREVLFSFIENGEIGNAEAVSKTNPESVINEFLNFAGDSGRNGSKESNDIPSPYSLSVDYSAYLSSLPEIKKDTSRAVGNLILKQKKLIDNFLLSPDKTYQPVEPLDKGNELLSEKMDTKADMLSNAVFTETLARIYFKQGRYEKCLEIIKELSLKNPKKSGYFADQISFLEKLINKIKKQK